MFHLEKFVLKKPYDEEVWEQYQLKISDRFAAFYDLYDNGTDRISKSHLKTVCVITNGRNINCGFMKNVQNF